MSRTRWQRKAPDLYWLSKERAAWLAGLIEGEGTIGARRHRYSKKTGIDYIYSYPRISVQMTDRDVIEKAHLWSGLGRVNGPYLYKTRPQNKAAWAWCIDRRDEVLTLIGAIWPYLGERRREQVRDSVQAWKDQAA